jgi:DNA polymerase-3 subunit epsilon
MPGAAVLDTFPRSNFIVERARAYLDAHRGRAPEDALLAHVFGQRGRVDLWRALLRAALERADGFVLRADETWEIPRAAPPGLDAYTVLDVETTGLDPRRQRVIEIALHRYRQGACVARWSTPLNPQRRVPAYVRHLTGLTEDGLAEAPVFATVVDEVSEWLAGEPLVGHNVAFDIAFLNAELARLDRPPLSNPTLDTLPLAVALVPRLRRPNLDAVANALGVMAPRRHRADADAAITAACFARLATRAAERGATTWDALAALAAGGAARPAEPARPARRGWSVMDRAWLDAIPSRPGVYLMRDAAGTIVYIGKAKNLRNRVRSYYSQPLGLTRKMDGLLETVKRIDVEVVGSELEALLLESRLIKQELPRYNIQLRYYDHYPFIRIDVDTPYPRIVATRALADDGARYFGPFRNAGAVQTTIDLITDLFPIRTCTNKVTDPARRWRPCLRLDFGQCLGPCVGRTTVAEYRALIDDIIAYLDGRREPLVNRLWEQLRAASDRLDFERAARMRDAIRQVTEVAVSQSLLTAAVARTHLLITLPSAEAGAREVLLILAGRLAAQVRLPAGEDVAVSAERLHAAWVAAAARIDADRPVGQETVDEIAIISRWLHQHEGSPAIVPLPDAPETLAGWTATVGRLPDGAHLAASPPPSPPGDSAADAVVYEPLVADP